MKQKYKDIYKFSTLNLRNLSLSALAFLLWACADGIVPEPATQGGPLQLRSVELPDASATRATSTAQLDKIGVYATGNSHVALSSNAKSVYALQNGTWSSEYPPLITQDVKLYAFSPYTLAVTNSSAGNHTVPVEVAADNFTASRQTDYLYAEPVAASASKRAVTFTMKHALAKVSFRVKKSANVQETLTLKNIELVSSTNRLQMGKGGTLNLANGTLNGLASTSSITLDGTVVLNTLQSDPNVSSLVAPMTATETRLSFRLTVEVSEAGSGTTTTRTFETAAVAKEVQWLAGYHYVYGITVDKMSGSLTNVQIDAWKSDANQNTGIGI